MLPVDMCWGLVISTWLVTCCREKSSWDSFEVVGDSGMDVLLYIVESMLAVMRCRGGSPSSFCSLAGTEVSVFCQSWGHPMGSEVIQSIFINRKSGIDLSKK